MRIIIEITPDVLKLIIRLAMLGGGVTGFQLLHWFVRYVGVDKSNMDVADVINLYTCVRNFSDSNQSCIDLQSSKQVVNERRLRRALYDHVASSHSSICTCNP